MSPLAAPEQADVRDFSGRSMGTSWSVRLVGAGDGAALSAGLQGALDAVVAQMSHWESDSDLSRFNRAPAGSWQPLPAAFYEVLSFALSVRQQSAGAYDPGAGALVNLWGFGPHAGFADPLFCAAAAFESGAAMVQRPAPSIELDPVGKRARQPGGVLLDLSSVAKGYGVDVLAQYLQQQDIQHYLVEVGGELRGAGTKPDGQPWWVALEQVSDDRADATGALPSDDLVLALHGLSVATSGDYRRYFERDGLRYSHTLDPRTGRPILHGLACVTVLHASCMAADAWSTALTVLGLQAGFALAERQGLAARFLQREAAGLSEHLSSAMRRMLDA